MHYEQLEIEGAGRWFSQLHESPWNEDVCLDPHFLLHKIRGDFNEVDFPEKIDLVFFDAFAPDKQPDVWNQPLFDRIFRVMNPGYPEGMMLAILFMNVFAPLIDYFVVQGNIKRREKRLLKTTNN